MSNQITQHASIVAHFSLFLVPQERAFIGLSWIPKATVQAALGSAPLDLIREKIDHDDPDFEEWEKWGKEILVTAVVSILLTAPIGLICISKLGPRWLTQDVVENGDELEPSHHAVAIVKDKVVDINDAWAINERNRRDDDTTIAVRKRTQAIRFFSKMKEQMAEIDKIIARDDKMKSSAKSNDGTVLLSELESNPIAPTHSPLVSSSSLMKGGDDNDNEQVKVQNKDNEEKDKGVVKTGLSAKSRQEVEKCMAILEDGIDAVWQVVEDNIELVPTADLFLRAGDEYKDVPTYEEMATRLHGMLVDAQADDFDGTPDATGARKQGRLGSFNLGSNPNLPQRGIAVQHSYRSFSGYKATSSEIATFKKEHQHGPHEI